MQAFYQLRMKLEMRVVVDLKYVGHGVPITDQGTDGLVIQRLRLFVIDDCNRLIHSGIVAFYAI